MTRLADPIFQEEYSRDALRTMNEAGLSDELKSILLSKNKGLIRIKAIQELDRVGLSPNISDKFLSTSKVAQGFSPTFTTSNINTSDFTINTSDFTTTHNNTNTNNDNTFTDTFSDTSTTSNDNSTDTTTDNTTTTSNQPDWLEIAVENIDSAIIYFEQEVFKELGSLYIVGGGIKPITDLTLGAEAQIRSADTVLYCVADPITERRIHTLNSQSKSLYDLYGNNKPRIETYKEMLNLILNEVRSGNRVCAVFYGHPGVFAWATHKAIRIARKEGYRAEMSPGVSAEDSLFADLGIDPSTFGFQSFDATDFLIRNRNIDPTCNVILWQIECVGDSGFSFAGYKKHNFVILINELCKIYPSDHPAVLYDASQFPHLPPRIQKLQLNTISKEHLSGISTLYLPPAKTPSVDREMCEKLGFK